MLCGCSKSDSFKVTLQIDKAEAPDNISVYYYGDSGLVKMEIA